MTHHHHHHQHHHQHHPMRIFYKENPRALVLVSRSHALLFRIAQSATGKPRCIVELAPAAKINQNHLRKLSHSEIHGFIGLIEVNNLIFLVTITGTVPVAQPIANQSVNRILNVDFFCLNSNRYDDLNLSSLLVNSTTTNTNPNIVNAQLQAPSQNPLDDLTTDPAIIEHPCNGLRKLLNDGSFYYSTNFDLTTRLQDRGIADNSLSIDTYKQEYMWNHFMMNEMIQFRNNASPENKKQLDINGFLTTVIRGFAKTVPVQVANHNAMLSIISRQSWKRAGTRYNARGIDDDGNVANFVETEIILHVPKQIVCSFVEIRGSIPVFWEQDSSQLSLSTPKVQITRSKEATHPVFLKHWSNLIDNYNTVHVVNLLSKKSSEIELSKRYKDHIVDAQQSAAANSCVTKDNTLLTEFDFHQQTKGGNYALANRILNYLNDSVEKFDYYSYSYQENKVMTTQQGVFRTNCLDCLDRTNLSQQVIASSILSLILDDYNLASPAAGPGAGSSSMSQLLLLHNALWADNGDQISQIYTGTNALKSSFSRSGKMTLGLFLSDATKSVTRMYQNNFVDKSKQITIDTLLGRIPGQTPVILFDPINESVELSLKQQESKFTHESIRSIFAGTFNLNGLSLTNTPNSRGDYESLVDWLMPDSNSFFYSDQPDVYVLGFQEVVELNASNILNSDYSRSSIWQKAINNLLNSIAQDSGVTYTLIRAEQMTSLLILFFAKSSIAEQITMVEGYTKKTGLGGITGNKGAIAIRFNIGATSYCVVNSHLASGNTAVVERNNDYSAIANGVYFSRGGKIFNHENVIWLGDLNYRVNLPNDQVRQELALLANDQRLSRLLAYDQLLMEIHAKNAFKNFEESEITFKPTYKFDNYTNNYDSSEKQRTPSWTDRILFKGRSLSPLGYDSCPGVLFSDHKPVYCLFETNVKFVNEKIKNEMKLKLYAKYKEKFMGQGTGNDGVSLVEVVNGKAKDYLVHSGVPSRPPRRANTISGDGSSTSISNSSSSGNLIDFDFGASTTTATPLATTAGTPPAKSHTFMNTNSSKNSSNSGSLGIDLLSLADKKSDAPPPPLPRRQPTVTSPSLASPSPSTNSINKSPSTHSSIPPPVPAARKAPLHSASQTSQSQTPTKKSVSAPIATLTENAAAPDSPTSAAATPPPGFSMSILQPRNKASPNSTGNNSTNTSTSTSTSNTVGTGNYVRKPPQTLASMAQQLELNKQKQPATINSGFNGFNANINSTSNSNGSSASLGRSPSIAQPPSFGANISGTNTGNSTTSTTSATSNHNNTGNHPPGYSGSSILLPVSKSKTGLTGNNSSNNNNSANNASTASISATATSSIAGVKKGPPPIVPKKPKNLGHSGNGNDAK